MSDFIWRLVVVCMELGAGAFIGFAIATRRHVACHKLMDARLAALPIVFKIVAFEQMVKACEASGTPLVENDDEYASASLNAIALRSARDGEQYQYLPPQVQAMLDTHIDLLDQALIDWRNQASA